MVWQGMFYFGVGGLVATLVTIPVIEKSSTFSWIYETICLISLIIGLVNMKRW